MSYNLANAHPIPVIMNTNSLSRITHLSHPKYRADIDGLRAIAILAVVGFHAFPTSIKGGFIGVDIFFVISGFLISNIIFVSLTRNSFNFSEFYIRRINRIFPALLLVLISCFVFGWFTLIADEYKQLGKHIAGGGGFISNFVLWNESGYFDKAGETKPLLHLWSLSIEEQFYLVWPLLLWLAWKQQFNLLTVAFLVALISFALNINYVRNNSVAAFYSPQTRFWELMTGSILAYVILYKNAALSSIKHQLGKGLCAIVYAHPAGQRGDTLRNLQSLLGGTLIITGIILLSKENSFPDWWALLPTFGTALIIGAGTHAWLNRVVLSHRVLTWFGLISYPLYLWHWPLLSFARIIEGAPPSLVLRITVVVASIMLAWLTYLLIEKPFRLGTHSSSKTFALLAAMTITGLAGLNCYQGNGYEFRVSPEIRMYVQNIDFEFARFIRYGLCHLETDDENKYDASCVETSRPLIALWGDSHASALYPGLKKLQEENNFGIMQFTNAACPPFLNVGTYSVLRKNCDAKNHNAIDLLIKNQPDILIMGSAFKVPGSAYTWDDLTLISKIDDTLKFLRSKFSNTQIIVIGPAPQWQESPQKVSYLFWKNPLNKTRIIPAFQKAIIFSELDSALKEITALNNVTYISTIQHLCNAEKCIARLGDTPESFTAVDYGHLSKAGSEYFMNLIKPKIFEQLTNRSKQ